MNNKTNFWDLLIEWSRNDLFWWTAWLAVVVFAYVTIFILACYLGVFE